MINNVTNTITNNTAHELPNTNGSTPFNTIANNSSDNVAGSMNANRQDTVADNMVDNVADHLRDKVQENEKENMIESKRHRIQERILTLANILTLGRIVLIPFVVLGFFIGGGTGAWLAFLAFAGASLTDFLDGYVARAFSQMSRFGQFLDPVADKLLVATTLLLLAGFHHITISAFVPAIIILCREILVSGLREFLSEVKVLLPVSYLAKWKTTIQMLALSALLLHQVPQITVPLDVVGEVLLWVAALITIKTGYDYGRAGLRHMVF